MNISPQKVCFIIVKAHEFDVKVVPVEPDPGSNDAESDMATILSDYPGDPTFEELVGAIESLNEEEMIDLLALVWLGRGDFTKDEWDAAVAEAEQYPDRRNARYLTGMPLLGDYLENALDQLDYSCAEFEIDRL